MYVCIICVTEAKIWTIIVKNQNLLINNRLKSHALVSEANVVIVCKQRWTYPGVTE